MASTYQQHAKVTNSGTYFPTQVAQSLTRQKDVFEANRHRIYALAFWMTDNEIAAENLMTTVFQRLFTHGVAFDEENVDRMLIAELREYIPIGPLTLDCGVVDTVATVRRNTLRVHLERAVVQLPATERLIFLMHDVEKYDHARIARTLGVTEEASIQGLHQARLRMRQLISAMI